ncbi:MAG: SIR2 family protein [Zoogloea sp.]|nr:SIR2 family protein [Zoogloea sp.]
MARVKIFSYLWNRIYTTNIDNVLSVAYQQAKSKGKTSADFALFNYTDPNLASNTIGRIPVVSIHGDIKRASEGFIFSSLGVRQGHQAKYLTGTTNWPLK